ncbi:MAG: DUF4276 family protein [Acidobacteria bacterium]|nr:DUF4276 family protein [Acidobacteriota bacterium]
MSIKLRNMLSFGPETPEIPLLSLNVLIGPSGAGKSNLIAMLYLLQATPRNLVEPIQIMAQVMEPWFHCDVEALQQYYGSCFRVQDLSARPGVEEIPKPDLFDGLKAAAKDCNKGAYSKGGHAFEILTLINPEKVRERAPHAERLLTCLAQDSGKPRIQPSH